MRKIIAVGLLLLGVPALAPAQDQGWAHKFFQGGLTHDFGNVPWGAQLKHKFTITNIYNAPFQVEEATVSCGCVSTVKPAGVIPPRGTAELEINMDTRKAGATGRPKVVNIFVKLTSVPQSAGEKLYSSRCTLTVSCLATGNIRYSHDKVQFGMVSLGATPQSELHIEHLTNPDFQITGVEKHTHPVEVKVESVAPRMGGRVAFRVVSTLKGDAPAGEIKYEAQLKTNDQVTRTLDVVMEGIIQAPLIATPNIINLGSVKVNEVVTGKALVRGPAGRTFKVLAVEGEGDGIKAKFKSNDSQGVHIVQFEFVPKEPGKVTKTLTIKTDLSGDLSAKVIVEGTGIK